MKNAATGFFRNETVCVSCNTNVELPFDHIAASPPHSLEMLLLSASVGFASQPGFACGTRLQDICDGCTENGPGDSFFSFLTLDQFHSTWTQGGFDLVVDVRSAEAYADGHIPGAFNAPGVAGLNGTEDLSSYSNLADCSDKKVAVSGHSRDVAPSPKD